jgi:hypothetical protein
MAKQDPWFIKERAVAFASLVLTKHNDVIVRPQAETDKASDLLVEILKDGKSTLRFFGVQLVGDIDLPDIQDSDGRVLSPLGRDPSEAMLPICVFVIGVRKPEGIYRWVVEPVVEDGRALLHRDMKANWQTLNEAGVARLLGQVNAWYNALNGNSTPKRRGRNQGSAETISVRKKVMHNTKFQVGDQVKYLGPTSTEAPANHGESPDVLLAPGMIGEVITVYSDEKDPESGKIPVCRVRFDSGFERTLFMNNLGRFERLP